MNTMNNSYVVHTVKQYETLKKTAIQHTMYS